MRLLFFGTPAIAVPFLEACRTAPGCELLAAVSQPDKPSGRGLKLQATPVKAAASAAGVRVLQPPKPSAIAAELKALGADLAVVVAYGRILKPDLLAAARLGFLNVHFSLLPKYRGAAPVQRALMEGETRTGVTLFWIDEGLDSGPVQRRAALDVGPAEDARELFSRLAELGVRELRAALADLAAGRVLRERQAGEPTLAPKISPEEARLDLGLPARRLHDRVRALAAGPKPYLELRPPDRPPARLAILRTSPGEAEGSGAPRGTILRVEREKGFLIQCSVGSVWVEVVQPEGKKALSAAEFLNGIRMKPGDRLLDGH